MAGVGLVAVVAVAVRPAGAVVVVVERIGSRCAAALEIFEADAARLPGDDDGPVVLPGALR